MTHFSKTLIRLASRASVIAVVALPAALAPSVAHAMGERIAETTPAVDVTDTSATLTALIRPHGFPVSYRFEYDSSLYIRFTPPAMLPGDDAVHAVSATVTGLAPDTLHRFRILAWRGDEPDDLEVAFGEAQKFRTAKFPVVTGTAMAGPGAATTPPAPPAPLVPAAPGAAVTGAPATTPPQPVPVLGQSVVVEVVRGAVRVQVPGQPGYVPVAGETTVPVGTLVDTRRGTVGLTAALSGGATQVGEFRGGFFDVGQSPAAGGLTELRLRGGNFAVCGRRVGRVRAGAAAAATGRKPPVRRLWSRDNGGRFLTRGRNSVATVRGTSWVTTDTCAGTRTTVTSGAVAVRDVRRKRTVLVRAGQSYLARSRR